MLNARIHPRPSWFPSVRQKDWILNWQVVICIYKVKNSSDFSWLTFLAGRRDRSLCRKGLSLTWRDCPVWRVWWPPPPPPHTRTGSRTPGWERLADNLVSKHLIFIFYPENFKENSKPSNWLGEASATNLVWSSVGLKKRIFSLSWSKHCDSNTSKLWKKWKKIFLRVLWQLW